MGNGWAHKPRERSSGRLVVAVFQAGMVALAVCVATGLPGDGARGGTGRLVAAAGEGVTSS